MKEFLKAVNLLAMKCVVKVYYPKEFYAATLTCMYNNKSGKTDERKAKFKTIQNECMKAGIRFLPIDIYKSLLYPLHET